jgi:hypothetical protein
MFTLAPYLGMMAYNFHGKALLEWVEPRMALD